jgi:biopolymer transport protein ExbD
MALGAPEPNGEDHEIESVGGIFSDINITPLTDIFLVLLIIFMVTTTAIAEAGNEGGFKVNLPRGSKAEEGAVPRDLTVAVLSDGRTVVAGKVLDEAALRDAFDTAHRQNPDTVVMFQADEGVMHGRVVEVMELARRAGLTRLAIATRAEQQNGARE